MIAWSLASGIFSRIQDKFRKKSNYEAVKKPRYKLNSALNQTSWSAFATMSLIGHLDHRDYKDWHSENERLCKSLLSREEFMEKLLATGLAGSEY